MRLAMLGHITNEIDLPQMAWWAFFLFFIGLVYWLRMQDKREGYPTKKSPFSSEPSPGVLPMPDPITYLTLEHGPVTRPGPAPQAPTSARPLYGFDGTPLSPVGNPLLAGIGPGAWVLRRPEPALTEKGEEVLKPLRCLEEWKIMHGETDPRGMTVLDRRFTEIGTVADIWIDRGAKLTRMFEVELHPGLAPGRVLVPIYHTAVRERARTVRVTALLAHQFADIPRPADPDSIGGQEEERLNAYFAAGWFYKNSPLTEPPGAGPIMGPI